MRRIALGALALLTPLAFGLAAPAAQAVPTPTPIDVTLTPASGPAGSVFEISGKCGAGQNSNDDWLVAISGSVNGTSLGDPIITGGDASDGAFSANAQALSDTDPSIPTTGDSIDITVDCESYLGSTAKGTATYSVTKSVPCPATLPDSTGSATSGLDDPQFPTTYTGDGFVPDSPVIACVYSTPQLIGAATATGKGAVSINLTDPKTALEAGTHTIAIIGSDIDTGDPVVLTSTIEVPQVEGVTVGGGLPLAKTGTPAQFGDQLLVGALLIAGGAALLLVTRRRKGSALSE